MKLYFSPFACSLAAHIVCREAALEVELVRADFRAKRVETGGDLRAVHPMGQVPTLVLDDGRVLTENSAVLSYLADRRPERALAPAPNSEERYEHQRWLSFVGTEIHKKGLAMFFDPTSPEPVKEFGRDSLAKPLGVVEAHLAGREVLVGDRFGAADAYLFWALVLVPKVGVSLEPYPALRAFYRRHLERPAVREALAYERAAHERPFAETAAS